MVLLLPGPSWPLLDFVKPLCNDALSPSAFKINSHPIFVETLTAEASLTHEVRTAFVVWDGSIVLSKWMQQATEDGNLSFAGSNVVEIGAGCAIPSIAARRLGAKHVTATDYQDALHSTISTIRINSIDSIGTVALDWNASNKDSTLCEIKRLQMGQDIDFILGSDVVWIMSLVKPFVDTLVTLLHSPKTVAYIAHQTRSLRVDEELFSLLTDANIAYRTVTESLHPVYSNSLIKIYEMKKRD